MLTASRDGRRFKADISSRAACSGSVSPSCPGSFVPPLRTGEGPFRGKQGARCAHRERGWLPGCSPLVTMRGARSGRRGSRMRRLADLVKILLCCPVAVDSLPAEDPSSRHYFRGSHLFIISRWGSPGDVTLPCVEDGHPRTGDALGTYSGRRGLLLLAAMIVLLAVDAEVAALWGTRSLGFYVREAGNAVLWIAVGLLAWRLRPTSRVGLLMAGFGLLLAANASGGFALRIGIASFRGR